MATEEERCAEAKELQRIDEAFRKGDLDGLRAAVNNPTLIPNGRMPDTIGACLVYAIYHSPFAFIRTLLEMGADPERSRGRRLPTAHCSAELRTRRARREETHGRRRHPETTTEVWRGPEPTRNQ